MPGSEVIGKHLPLHEWHASHGADFAPLGEWAVPRSYGSVESEYRALRSGIAIADHSHQSRIRVEGPDAAAFLNDLLTINITAVKPGSSRQAFFCNGRGGIIDAVVVYRDENFFLLLGNATCRGLLLDWLAESQARLERHHAQVIDASVSQRQISLLGPRATDLLRHLFSHSSTSLEPGEGAGLTMGSARVLLLRRLFHEIPGYHLITGSIFLNDAWSRITEAGRLLGARPAGTDAIEILRVENGLPAMGSEMDGDTTPLEVDQATYVDFHKPRFSGRRAMLHSTSSEFSRTLTGLRITGDQVPPPGSEVLFDGMNVGRITSSVASPATGGPLALAFINSVKATPGNQMMVQSADGPAALAETIRLGQVPPRQSPQ